MRRRHPRATGALRGANLNPNPNPTPNPNPNPNPIPNPTPNQALPWSNHTAIGGVAGYSIGGAAGRALFECDFQLEAAYYTLLATDGSLVHTDWAPGLG